MARTKRGRLCRRLTFNPDVGGTGHEDGVGILLQPVQELLQCLGTDKFRPAGDESGPFGGRRRHLASDGQRVRVCRRAEGVGGVADGPVAGAAAQVSAQRVQIKTVGALVCSPLPRGGGPPFRTVVLGRHGADKAGRAVAALGTAAVRHFALDRVELLGAAGTRSASEPLGRDNFPAVESQRRRQAGVDGGPAGAVRARRRAPPARRRRRIPLRRSLPWPRSAPGRAASRAS